MVFIFNQVRDIDSRVDFLGDFLLAQNKELKNSF